MITEYILIAFLAVYAVLFYAMERRLEKSQQVIVSLMNDFARNISEQGAEMRKQVACLDKNN